jgi:hypothetical protein
MNTVLWRFYDLRERGIVRLWPQLRRLQVAYGFPLGRLISPNTRTWLASEVDAWIATRPVENTRPLQGAAKARRERRRKAGQSRVDGEAMLKNGNRPGPRGRQLP